MPAASSSDVKFEIGHVLFIDIGSCANKKDGSARKNPVDNHEE